MTEICGKRIGAAEPCFIIAELGTSHRGSAARARELVDAAAETGADCIKLQLVHAEEILHPLSGAVDLPTGRIELYRQFQELERDVSFYGDVKRHVEKRGLVFLCSAFGLRSARELKALGVAAMKIASPELNHFPLLREAGSYGIPLFLSSGVSSLGDIEKALALCGRDTILLHCITAYPAPEAEYNVRLIGSLRRIFGVETGLSDHSLDPVLVPALSVLNGACVVEKHFTLSRSGGGLDDPIALEPGAFAGMVRIIRETQADAASARRRLESEYGAERVAAVEGTGIKTLAPSEKQNYSRTNRSIHALSEIKKGEIITEKKVSILRTEKILRPGLGPEFLPAVIGAQAQRSIPAGEGVEWEDVISHEGKK